MTLLAIKQKIADRVSVNRVVILSLLMSGLVGVASAATLNDSVYPIIVGVTLLFVPLLAVIVAGVPLVVTIAISICVINELPMLAYIVHTRHSGYDSQQTPVKFKTTFISSSPYHTDRDKGIIVRQAQF